MFLVYFTYWGNTSVVISQFISEFIALPCIPFCKHHSWHQSLYFWHDLLLKSCFYNVLIDFLHIQENLGIFYISLAVKYYFMTPADLTGLFSPNLTVLRISYSLIVSTRNLDFLFSLQLTGCFLCQNSWPIYFSHVTH